MPDLKLPALGLFENLLARVEAERPELLPVCRRLVLGPDLGRLILPGAAPSAADLVALLRLLRDREPSLLPLGEDLTRSSEHHEAAQVELCVDLLIAHEDQDWQHPSLVLDRPRPALDKLLDGCRARLQATPEPLRDRVHAVIDKVERAARIAASARERRERMDRRRRR
jgi:hypothetical protein